MKYIALIYALVYIGIRASRPVLGSNLFWYGDKAGILNIFASFLGLSEDLLIGTVQQIDFH